MGDVVDVVEDKELRTQPTPTPPEPLPRDNGHPLLSRTRHCHDPAVPDSPASSGAKAWSLQSNAFGAASSLPPQPPCLHT